MTDRSRPPGQNFGKNVPNGRVEKEALSDALRNNLRRRKERARERGPDEGPERPTLLRPDGK